MTAYEVGTENLDDKPGPGVRCACWRGVFTFHDNQPALKSLERVAAGTYEACLAAKRLMEMNSEWGACES